MSKRQLKSQASSARAASSAFHSGFGTSSSSAFGANSSPLSYVTEPPDLSSISDPNVVVYFRNLSKKDSTTKAKALEDIQTYVASLKEPVEEGVLEAWIKMYPRTSIDNAKAVRQGAHVVHGQISSSAGKRIARHMPKTVGAWLCGLYDSDRSVAEATQNSLRQVFNSPEKIQNIRKAYQQPILEYCRDAIDKESALTLSDERTVTPDDAEAKYSRVISACISLVGSLLANLKIEELAKFQTGYEGIVADDKLWTFASYNDASIRRSLHRFLKTCLVKEPDAVRQNLEHISKAYLSVALNSHQTSSAYDYVDTLALLTSAYPTVWTDHYKSKTPVDRRLRQFLKRGSQSGPREFWERLTDVFKAVPKEILPKNGADAADLLNALHGGIARKDESRLSLETAFNAYLEIATMVCKPLSDDDQRKLTTDLIFPIISQYLRPTSEQVQWAVPRNSLNLVSKAMQIGSVSSILEEEWPRFMKLFIDDIKTSAPEQSKDYERSQNALIQEAVRITSLQEHALKAETSTSLRPLFVQTSSSIIKEALSISKTRNGKPYGATGTIAEFLYRNKALVLSDKATEESLERFIQDDLPALIISPSSTQLANILYSASEASYFNDAWSATLKSTLKADNSPAKVAALEALLTSSKIPSSIDLATSDLELQNYIQTNVHTALQGDLEWDSFNRILQSPLKILSPTTTDEILSSMAKSLSLSQQAPYALQGFRQIVKQNPSLLKSFIPTPQGSSLLQSLLLASESPNEVIAQEAMAVNASIQTILSAGSDSKQSIYNVISQGLREASLTSVSVETLVDLARQLVNSGSSEEIKGVLPDMDEWNTALEPFLDKTPKSSLAITNPLGGAVYLVQPAARQSNIPNMDRDAYGYSAAFRTAQYVGRLFKNEDLFKMEDIPSELRNSIFRNLALTVQLADDNLGLAGANHLWAAYNPEVEADAITFISEARVIISQDLKRKGASWSGPHANSSLLVWGTNLLSEIDIMLSAKAYYTARTYSVLVSDAIELCGWSASQTAELQTNLKTIRKSKDILALVGFLNAFKEPLAASQSCERMCNELVADLTGLDIEARAEDGLRQLILLNTLVYVQEDIKRSISKQRLVFFVKHVVPWLDSYEVALPIRAEVCRSLTALLPIMADIYGEHWRSILDALAASWGKTSSLQQSESEIDSQLPFVHASLKLYALLRTLLTQEEEPNDDLVDAWKETEQEIANGLVNLLKNSLHFPDEFHQPLKILNDVLARQISKVPIEQLESSEDLFPLLYVESHPVQQAAFDILHKQIPAAQEQISIDSALDKTTARLPEELLSLILEAPTLAALGEANFERSVPLPLRGYLLSWLLVFDHLEHSSFKVKNDYVEHIKEGDYLPGLLSFTFDFLGHAHSKPVDVSKFDVTTYTPDLEPPQKDAQWLLTHLYFLCLRYIPSLAKSWWIDCKSRPIVVTLEAWTEKYISSPVITAALQSVTTWSDAQLEADADSPFTVKVAPRAREITASYTIDDQTMSMRVTLPAAFPLANARVEGINRVAVNEAKWQSWLRISLGAITIFNGSLIDALTTFKRNVDGAMKGQTECSICYSIVGSDRKLPDKRCGTCRNLFHGGCLFKWFKSSGSSSCPLCRNAFNYG